MDVVIIIGLWEGCKGILEDKIPNSDWYNVRVLPNLRLALTEQEFNIL